VYVQERECMCTYERVTAHIWMSHVTHKKEWCLYIKCISFMQMSHVVNIKSCHTLLLWVLCRFTGFARRVWGRSECSPDFIIQSDLCIVRFCILHPRGDTLRMCDMTQSHVTHAKSCHTYATYCYSHTYMEYCYTYEEVMAHTCMSHMIWLMLVASIKV